MKDVQRRYVINKTLNYVFGFIFFIANNETKEGRTKNRRIDIVITPAN